MYQHAIYIKGCRHPGAVNKKHLGKISNYVNMYIPHAHLSIGL